MIGPGLGWPAVLRRLLVSPLLLVLAVIVVISVPLRFATCALATVVDWGTDGRWVWRGWRWALFGPPP